jgi:serine/threonine protein kinase
MTPERWQQIDHLLEQALERAPSQRCGFLDEACAGDEELRREVEALLVAHEQAGNLLSSPALEAGPERRATDPSKSLVGQDLSHYRILSLLGQGGMGVVYKARDRQLERHVALKVLPPHLVADRERKKRFAQEAKAASALNHPNIVTIHEIASDHRVDFIVMELVAGKTLDRLIPRQGMRLNEALKLATQMADALTAAHAAGIVHRDFKPSNVMVGENGQVKVLDFGLAKLIHKEHSEEAEDTRTDATRSGPNTEEGTLLGTASYMSPEQAEGMPVDARSDIFSFGSVLYEMVTGKRAFQGDSTLSTMTAILRDDPPPLALVQKEAPPELERIITKALEKDREVRYQTALDLRADLKRLHRKVDSERETHAVRVQADSTESSSHEVFSWKSVALAGALTLLLVAVGVGWYVLRQEGPQLELTQRQLTTNSSETPVTAAAISPDGKYLAFADENGAYLRLIDTGERHSIAVPASLKISHLAWFPDGTKLIASGANGEEKASSLWSVSILGGSLRKLRDEAEIASVSPDGLQIAFVSSAGNEIWLMGSDGAEPREMLTGSGGDRFQCLMWFPNGQRLAYGKKRPGPYALDLESCDLKGGSVTTIFSGLWLNDSCLMSDGRLIYSRAELLNQVQASLWEISMDMRTGKASGKPRRIISSPGISVRGLSASRDAKRLAFLKEISQADIYVGELEENGKRMKVPQRLTFDDRYDFPAAWTPDSKAVIFSSDRNGNFDIFKQVLGQRSAEAIMAGPEGELDPTVSSDGAWILYFALPTPFRRASENPVSLKRAPISGGPSRLVLNERGFSLVHCASRSSNLCIVDQRNGTQLIFFAFDPLQGKGKELARTDLKPGDRNYYWDLSPDGLQIAISTGSAQDRIRVLSLAGGASREVVVHGWDHLSSDSWSADGKGWFVSGQSAGSEALLHVDQDGHAKVLWQQPISYGGLWAIPSPDGRYLAFPASTSTGNAWMIENF